MTIADFTFIQNKDVSAKIVYQLELHLVIMGLKCLLEDI